MEGARVYPPKTFTHSLSFNVRVAMLLKVNCSDSWPWSAQNYSNSLRFSDVQIGAIVTSRVQGCESKPKKCFIILKLRAFLSVLLLMYGECRGNCQKHLALDSSGIGSLCVAVYGKNLQELTECLLQ